MRCALAKQGVAHVVEEARLPRRLSRFDPKLGFQLADARIGALERLVLHQRGLHQRIHRVRRALDTVVDRLYGVVIARRVFQRSQTIEQFVDQFAFLRRHGIPPCRLRTPAIM